MGLANATLMIKSNTEISEMYRSLDCLLKDLDFKNFRVLYKDNPDKQEELLQMEKMFPNPVHPVIITHPETLQRVIFVNRQFTLRIKGLSDDESRSVLELLYAQASIPEYQFRLKW